MIRKIFKISAFFCILFVILFLLFFFFTDSFLNNGWVRSAIRYYGLQYSQCSGSLRGGLAFAEVILASPGISIKNTELTLGLDGFRILCRSLKGNFQPHEGPRSTGKLSRSLLEALVKQVQVKEGCISWGSGAEFTFEGVYKDRVFMFSGMYDGIPLKGHMVSGNQVRIEISSLPLKKALSFVKTPGDRIPRTLNGNVSISITLETDGRKLSFDLRTDPSNMLSLSGLKLPELSLKAGFDTLHPGLSSFRYLTGLIGRTKISGRREIDSISLNLEGEVNSEELVLMNEYDLLKTNSFMVERLDSMNVKLNYAEQSGISCDAVFNDLVCRYSKEFQILGDFQLTYQRGNYKLSSKRANIVSGQDSLTWRGTMESMKIPRLKDGRLNGELKVLLDLVTIKLDTEIEQCRISCISTGSMNFKMLDDAVQLQGILTNKAALTFQSGSRLEEVESSLEFDHEKAVMSGKGVFRDKESRQVILDGNMKYDLRMMIQEIFKGHHFREKITESSINLTTYEEPLENFRSYFPKEATFDKSTGKIIFKGFLFEGTGKYCYRIRNEGPSDKSFVFNGFICLDGWTENCPAGFEMNFSGDRDSGTGKIMIGQGSSITFDIRQGTVCNISGKVTLDDINSVMVSRNSLIDSIPEDFRKLPLDLGINLSEGSVRMIFSYEKIQFLELTYTKSGNTFVLSSMLVKKEIPLKTNKFNLESDMLFNRIEGDFWVMPFKASLKGYQIKSSVALSRKLKIGYSEKGYALSDFILDLYSAEGSYGTLKGDVRFGNHELDLLVSGESIDILGLCRINGIKIINVDGLGNLYLKVKYGMDRETLDTDGKIEIFVPEQTGFGHVIINEFNPEMLKLINPEIFNRIPFKKMFAEFTFNRDLGIDVGSIKMSGPVINLIGHGKLDVEGNIDFDFSAGMSARLSDGIKEKQFKKFKNLFYRSGNFIVDFSLTGSVYYPKFIPNFSGKTYKYFLKNIYRDPNILLKILFSF